MSGTTRYVLLLAAILLLAGLACGGIPNLGVQLEDGAALVTIRLQEEQVQRLVEESVVCAGNDCSGDEFLDEVTGIDFREGVIHVTGTYTDANGQVAEGSYDVEFGATNGALDVRITNMDVEGVEEAQVERVNQKMAEDFARTAAEGNVEFVTAQVGDEELVMEVRVIPN